MHVEGNVEWGEQNRLCPQYGERGLQWDVLLEGLSNQEGQLNQSSLSICESVVDMWDFAQALAEELEFGFF